MSSFNDKIGHLDDNFKIFHIRDKKELNFDYHHHDFNKIIIFISGDVKYFIEGKTYTLKPWDILFINNNDIHKPIVNKDVPYERIVIWLNPKIKINDIENNNSLLNCFDLSKKLRHNLLRLNAPNTNCLKKIVNEIINSKDSNLFGSEILNYSLFLVIMVYINRWFIENEKRKDGVTSYKIVDDIVEYINSNIDKDLSIDTLAQKFHISKFSLSRYFKSKTGNSLHNYILKRRLVYAKALIVEGYSMKSAATKCGFNDYSTFVRGFKKEYNISPRDYLKSIKENY
ncbi:MAG: helix-turn-helix domain-containing protein [Clostridium sp.]|nr:helix-turn-helix domain-containing protein [Clostridium sp.]